MFLPSAQAAILAIEWHRLENSHLEAIRTRLAESVAPNTANKKLAALRGVLKKAWKLGLMTREEYERAVDIERVKGERLKRGRDVSQGEIRAMFESCRDEASLVGLRDSVMLALLYGAGLRRAEAAALKLSNWNAEKGEIIVRGKGNKDRAIPLPDGTRRALVAWLMTRGPLSPDDPLLCPLAKGDKIINRRISTQAIWKALLKRARKAGVASLSPHDFRRSYIGDLLDAGVDLSTAQKLAGHSDPKITATYDRRPEGIRREAASKLFVPFVEGGYQMTFLEGRVTEALKQLGITNVLSVKEAPDGTVVGAHIRTTGGELMHLMIDGTAMIERNPSCSHSVDEIKAEIEQLMLEVRLTAAGPD